MCGFLFGFFFAVCDESVMEVQLCKPTFPLGEQSTRFILNAEYDCM